MKPSRLTLFVIGIGLIFLAAPVTAATPTPAAGPSVAAAPVCGKYKGIKPAKLTDILKQHAAWIDASGPNNPKLLNDPRRANLYSVDLTGAILTGANLRGAILTCTNLTGVDLQGATLTGANLQGATLTGTNLRGATLAGANLSGADLFGADLTGANLMGVDLTGAKMIDTLVSKAKLAGVNLKCATYATKSEPPDPYVVRIKGLARIATPANGERIGLIQLRKLLQDAGLSDNVREVTCSIQRNITRDQLLRSSPFSEKIKGWLRTAGFEWITAYGLHPQRALRWILLLGAVLTPVYTFAMWRPTAASGVMRVFPADRLEGTAGDPADEEKRKKQLVRVKGWRAFRSAAYFSLISAVNIGFEDFTPGDWIRRLQTREYSLEAVGWVRVIAGAQALLSLYLLAMWVLTQFGQPFE